MVRSPLSLTAFCIAQNLRTLLIRGLSVFTWAIIAFVLELADFPKFVPEQNYVTPVPRGWAHRMIFRSFDSALDDNPEHAEQRDIARQWTMARGLKTIAKAKTLHVHGTECLIRWLITAFKNRFLDGYDALIRSRVNVVEYLRAFREWFPAFAQVMDAFESRSSLTRHSSAFEGYRNGLIWRRDVSFGGEFLDLPYEFATTPARFRLFVDAFDDFVTVVIRLIVTHWMSRRVERYEQELQMYLRWDGLFAQMILRGRRTANVDFFVPTSESDRHFVNVPDAEDGTWWIPRPSRNRGW